MFDRPVEIALTLNLLKPKELLPVGLDFNNEFIDSTDTPNDYKAINLDKFKQLTKNLISYYRGAPPQSYPKIDFNIVKCKMSDFQYKSYLTSQSNLNDDVKGFFKNVDLLKLPTDFLLGPRMISNVAFPNKSIGDIGFSSFKGTKLEIQNIKKFSIKFYKIFKNIKKSDGPIFIYSNFKNVGGLKSFIEFIEFHGYKNYKVFGEGLKTYAVLSGDEPHYIKEEIKHIFNQKENADGSRIQIMLGSPSIKEGVTLLRVDQIHILEPYWNLSRIQQIIGRGVRYKSHEGLPKSLRNVDIYRLYSIKPEEYKTIKKITCCFSFFIRQFNFPFFLK